MPPTVQFIDLLAAAALLLWGLRLIRTGVMRAFGATLRQWISRATRNRLVAALWGMLATLGLQSSTATAVITGSFAARGIMSAPMAQAVMLGANLGTAMVAAILSVDVHWIASLCILSGVVTFSTAQATRGRGIGRALIGLGLMLLALRLMGEVTAPLQHSETLALVIAGLGEAPLVAALLAAGLAVLSASSLAVVLLVMVLAAGGLIDTVPALALVAGANVGGAVTPWLAVAVEGPAARRITLGNLVVRITGAAIVLGLTDPLALLLEETVAGPGHRVIAAHIAFSAVLLVLFLPLVGPLCRLVERFLPDPPEGVRGAAFLDESLLETPAMALAVAARETLRVGDIVGEMLDRSRQALIANDELAALEVSRLEPDIDRLSEAIKLYITRLSRAELDEPDVRRASEITSFAINLEHMGDIIEAGLADAAMKKIRKRLAFSPEGAAELADVHDRTIANLRLAQAVFLGRDADLARQLVESKIEIRRLEAVSAERHLGRLRAGRPEAMETSTIHLDLLRDLKRLNAHVTSVAHPILTEIGALRESRMRASAPRRSLREQTDPDM
ncbi:Na/Pi cotransporter family protein [Cereibacter azotoformans]|uniref:Phosphate:Na+ symporter n=1 Tax=Cereibacter azotoformans TaxID=43057 RepID=A0A2T5KA07_9RHOB|nr:Na/Pi cotransporter family protein [Cereibacter azotoformans]PTR19255.1 phosphate:Na+ symporter [Cereibacter azotoformans]